MSEEAQTRAPTQEQPAAPAPKKGAGKLVAVIAVVAVIVIAVLAVALMPGSGIAGKWNMTSIKVTMTINGTEYVDRDNSTGNWVEFKADGTGMNNIGDTFSWEASDGRLTITDDTNDVFGTMGVPFDYTLDGAAMTIRGMFAAGMYVVITLERA